MSCCRDMDKREYIPGRFDAKSNAGKGGYAITGRPHWTAILGDTGRAFVRDLLKRMIEHEKKHNGKSLVLTKQESEMWHKYSQACNDEGWTMFYFNKHDDLMCASIIRLDFFHEEPVEMKPREKQKPGPLAPMLDGFVHEPGDRWER
jgi:hypothetical protein